MLVTLRGKIQHREFVTEEGVIFSLHGDFGVSDDIFILCRVWEDDNSLSIFRRFKAKT